MSEHTITTELAVSVEAAASGHDRSAWFVCRARGVVDDVMLSIKAGVTATEAEFAAKGRMKAARHFKRKHELHPCTKVEVEFQGIVFSAKG